MFNNNARVGTFNICAAVVLMLHGSMSYGFGLSQTAQSTTSFSQSTTAATDSLRNFYQGLNQVEREFYFHKLRFDSTLPMEAIGANGKSTGLLNRLSDGEIQARVLVLSLLSNYTENLAQLASSTESTIGKDTAQAIGLPLSNVSGALAALGLAFPALGVFTGPIASLSGMTVDWWVGRKREAVLKQTILINAPTIRALFKLLETDVEQICHEKYQLRATKELDDYVAEYKQKFSSAQSSSANDQNGLLRSIDRQLFLDRAQRAADRKVAADGMCPLALILKMETLHNDLVAYASATKIQPFSLDIIAKDLDAYSMEAKTILDYILQMRNQQ